MIIGLTGGIASGKTTVSNFLRKKGFLIYDADVIAKKITEDSNVIKEIVLKFGNEILNDENKLDRKKMREVIFKDGEKIKILDNIVHPKVYKFFEEKKKENLKEQVVFFDVPLLFESGTDVLCDKIVLVVADEKIRIKRIVMRDQIDENLAKKMILSQLSDEEKIKKSDIVIENNGTLEELLIKLERFCKKL